MGCCLQKITLLTIYKEKERKGMWLMTEKMYALKLMGTVKGQMKCLSEDRLEEYYKRIKVLMGTYRKLVIESQVVLEELEAECQEKINENLAYALDYINKYDYRINVARLHYEMENLLVIYGLSDLIHRSLILTKYYAPQGKELEEIIRKCYCNSIRHKDEDIQLELGYGRSKFYERKKTALKYLGFYFYEIVLPLTKIEEKQSRKERESSLYS